jgi:PIN like domain
VRFYFDRTQSPYLARAAGEVLSFLGHTFEHSRRRYPDRDPGDITWMGELAAEGDWVVITGDEAIRRNPAERRAWRETRLTTFFLQPAWMHTRMDEQAWRLLRWLPRLVDIAGSETIGTALSVSLRWHGGKLQRVYSPRQR